MGKRLHDGGKLDELEDARVLFLGDSMTFGHGGARGQLAWADPASGVSFGFMTHGLQRHQVNDARRSVAISTKAGLLTTPVD